MADINKAEAIIIDPVVEHGERDAQLLTELGFKLKYAGEYYWTNLLFYQYSSDIYSNSVNTHVHADHITGTGYLKQLLPGTLSVISEAGCAKADKQLANNETLQFGRHVLKAVSTPGHTCGCMSFIVDEQVNCVTFTLKYVHYLFT